MRSKWVLFALGISLLAGPIILTEVAEAAPPYVKEGAPTEVTFPEDEPFSDLNLYDVFADDDPGDVLLNLSHYDVDDLEVTINQTTGNVTLTGADDFHGEVDVKFRAEDAGGYFAIHTVTAIIQPVNDPPMALGKVPRHVWWEGQDSHINVSQYFEDVEGDALFYYAEVEPDGYYSIMNRDGDPRDPWFDILCQHTDFYGFLQVTFSACDMDPAITGEGTVWAVQEAIFEVEGVNDAPVIVEYEPEGPSVQVNETEQVTFRIVSVDDPDGSTFTYRWYVDGEEVASGSEEAFAFPEAPSYGDAGTYNITVQVYDSMYARARNPPEWTLTILDVNRAPEVIPMWSTLVVGQGEAIILDLVATDPDGDNLNYTWYRSRDRNTTEEIGTGPILVYKKDLPPRKWYFMCVVDDGKDTNATEWAEVNVEPRDTPGPSAPMALLAMAISTVAVLVSTRSRSGHSKAY